MFIVVKTIKLKMYLIFCICFWKVETIFVLFFLTAEEVLSSETHNISIHYSVFLVQYSTTLTDIKYG